MRGAVRQREMRILLMIDRCDAAASRQAHVLGNVGLLVRRSDVEIREAVARAYSVHVDLALIERALEPRRIASLDSFDHTLIVPS